jgi:hypothetical protein
VNRLLVATTNDAQKIAFAGVGKPIKIALCRSSMLNFANRNAEKTAMRNAEKLKKCHSTGKLSCITEKTIAEGATPKLTMSAKESSSLPIGE